MSQDTQSPIGTTKCPKCQEDIQLNAVKCKHCGADLRSWIRRHPLLFAGIIFVFLPVVIMVSSSAYQASSSGTSSQETKTVDLPDKELAMAAMKLINEFDESKFRGDVDKLVTEVNFFTTMSKAGREAQASNDPEARAEGEKVLKALSKLQASQFPKMRKAYAEIAADKGWIENIKVSVSGDLNQNITFVSGVFANNKNIAELHSQLESTLTGLRFDRVNYKWIPSASEWSYYDLKSLKDADI